MSTLCRDRACAEREGGEAVKQTVKKAYCVVCGQNRDHIVTVTKKTKTTTCAQCAHKVVEKLS